MNNIATTQQTGTFSLTPRTLEEAMKFADIMAKSSIVPKNYQGKPADVLVAVQMGSEIGLKPMQSLQNIAVINGKPSIYGDALIALVQAHPEFENIIEYFDEQLQAATCIVKRANQSEHTVLYSIEDAKKAGLWGKVGPWQQYPKRMLQMRARGFALRDKFADALGGLISQEEARDYPIDITPKYDENNRNMRLEGEVADNKNQLEQEVKDEIEAHAVNLRIQMMERKNLEVKDEIEAHSVNLRMQMMECKNLEELKTIFLEAQKTIKSYFPLDYAQSALDQIIRFKDQIKDKLEYIENVPMEEVPQISEESGNVK
jgi:hypothetical protein